MFRKIFNILISLGLATPIILSAGALDRYQVPQKSTKSATIHVDKKVYIEFREKVKGYSPEKREKLKEYYRQKMKQAIRDKNFDAASHYEKLLDILNSF